MSMATIQKWGNSLGVRLPQPLAAQLGLRAGSAVELAVADGRLTITPRSRHRMSLEGLLQGVPPAGPIGEVDWGKPVGNEEW
jgi:antitoxin MazE